METKSRANNGHIHNVQFLHRCDWNVFEANEKLSKRVRRCVCVCVRATELERKRNGLVGFLNEIDNFSL